MDVITYPWSWSMLVKGAPRLRWCLWITLTSWKMVYIRVFILRKFSNQYGLIWVYIQVYTFSVRWKSEQRCEIPTENLVHEIHWRQISPHDYAGNWPSFCWKHTYLSLRWPLHMVNQIFHQYLWRYLQQKVAYSVNTWHENIMATCLASMFTDVHQHYTTFELLKSVDIQATNLQTKFLSCNLSVKHVTYQLTTILLNSL